MSGWTSTTTSGQGYQQHYDQHRQQYAAYHRGPTGGGGGAGDRGQAPIASFEDLSLASFELSPEDSRLNRGGGGGE